MNNRFMFLMVGLATLLVGCKAPETPPLVGMAETREIMVASKLSGRLSAMMVAEGDSVTVGMIVARIGSPEVEAKVEQARGMLRSADARLHLVRKGVREEELSMAQTALTQATEARKLAESTWKRVQKLYQDSAIPRQQADEAEFKWRSTQENETALATRLEMMKNGARPEELDVAEGASQSAFNALAEAETWKKETLILCPVSGIVQKRYLGVGEIAAAGAPILVLINPDDIWISLAAREDQLANLRIGSVLRGEIPALGLVDVEFRISWMTAMGDFATWRSTSRKGDADLRSFEVRLEPLKHVPGLFPGMTVRFAQPKSKG